MKRKERKIAGWCRRLRCLFLFDVGGAVAVELGLVTPFLAILTISAVDLGNLFNFWQGLALAARVGAEYAKNSATCQAGINLFVNPPDISTACMTNIESAMTNSLNYSSSSLTYPNLVSCTTGISGQCFPVTCECDDGTSIACGSSCAAASRPAPNRVFIAIAARQSYAPMIAWPGMPSAINGAAELRLQ